jgi:steroid 5-alpha reductase family enzyme
MSFFVIAISSIFLMAIIMLVAWLFARRLENYSLVDAVWAFGFALLATINFALADGWLYRRFFIFVMVAAWGLRLGTFLALRIAQHHPKEDNRYAELRKVYAPKVASGFFRFYQIQALSVAILSLPFLMISEIKSESFSVIEIIGFVFWSLSFAGESVADFQMSRFKLQPSNRGKTCQVGLWKYSRHPNYFFEACMWFGYFIIALASPNGVWTLYAPLAILYLLLKVTGVPPSEAQALKSRGDEFRDYQRRTSMFIPWFPKASAK